MRDKLHAFGKDIITLLTMSGVDGVLNEDGEKVL